MKNFKPIQPVQIIGTQRSGSNLLRLMLNQHPKISAPHPPHILQRFLPLLEGYGDLVFPENRDQLLSDVLQLVALNPVSWNFEAADFQQIKNEVHLPALMHLFKSIYEHKARQEQAEYWVCKSMCNVHFADLLEKEDIKPLYIHLYRDGRDVAASFKKVVVGEKHIYHLAKQWQKDQEACLDLKNTITPDRFLPVCYEALISDPEKELTRIFDFLGVHYMTETLNYYQSEESKKAASAGKMWKNVALPCMRGNYHKYLTELSSEEIFLFEHVTHGTLQQLGYPINYIQAEHLMLTSHDIENFHQENQRLKNNIRQNLNGEDYEKIIPQQMWIREITNRKKALMAS